MHNYLTLIFVFVTMSVFTSINAYAEDSERAKQIEEKFKTADKNGDNKLTLEEAKAGMPRVARAFSKIDINNQGYITLDDIKAKAD